MLFLFFMDFDGVCVGCTVE